MTKVEADEILKSIQCTKEQETILKLALNSLMAWELVSSDIEIYEADCNLSIGDDEHCKRCNQITFNSIRRIINKHLYNVIKGGENNGR